MRSWATAATLAISLIQVAVVLPMFTFTTAEMPQLIADAKAWTAVNAGLLFVISLVVLLLTLLMLYLAAGIFSRMVRQASHRHRQDLNAARPRR